MSHSRNYLKTVVVAFVTGLVGGILIAPRKGTKTRRMIRSKGNKLVSNVTGEYEKDMDALHELKDNVIQTVKDSLSGLKGEFLPGEFKRSGMDDRKVLKEIGMLVGTILITKIVEKAFVSLIQRDGK